eukprot:6270001-Prymnesium_polylepis.1
MDIALHDGCVGKQRHIGCGGELLGMCDKGALAGGGGAVFAGSCAAAEQPDAASLLPQAF